MDHLIYYPEAVWTLEVGELDMTGQEIVAELRNITTLHGAREFPAENSISARESSLDWGASSSFGEYILELSISAVGGVGAVALGSALRTAFEKIRSHGHAPTTPRGPVDADEARRLLYSHIALHYGLKETQLTEISHTHSPADGVHEFSFTTDDGFEYGGVIGSPNEPLECTRVWKKTGPLQLRPEYAHIEPAL
ncbi:hypothetical protein ACIO7M_06315 [Streptomyces toxytricini]|uniref:Uncharacterized protein n=1 Tax=Streptomyces toxytricini TaxID=67369 RepID=A0ABW8EBU4_STRT5